MKNHRCFRLPAHLFSMFDYQIQTGVMMSDVYDTLINVIARATDSAPRVYVYRFQFEGEIHTMKSIYLNSYDERIEGISTNMSPNCKF